jgi:Protein of unknown function (DUF3465)
MEARLGLIVRGLAAPLLVLLGLAGAPAASLAAPPLHVPVQARFHVVDPAAEAYRAHRSGITITVEGRVKRVLPDIRSRSRHQRFIIETVSGLSVVVSHNLDLAPRVGGLQPGEPLVIRGEYVWNPKGGLLHWTHHDPRGRHGGGYIERRGRRYE